MTNDELNNEIIIPPEASVPAVSASTAETSTEQTALTGSEVVTKNDNNTNSEIQQQEQAVSNQLPSAQEPPEPTIKEEPQPQDDEETTTATEDADTTIQEPKKVYEYDPNKVTLKFLFANRDDVHLLITYNPSDTIKNVKGELLSQWPEELSKTSPTGERVRLVCMGRGTLHHEEMTLEQFKVPVFETHPTPVNVSVKPILKVSTHDNHHSKKHSRNATNTTTTTDNNNSFDSHNSSNNNIHSQTTAILNRGSQVTASSNNTTATRGCCIMM